MKHLNNIYWCLILMALAPLSFAVYPRAGYEAELSTIHHSVSGTVTIADANTLIVENFNYVDGAPAVYFYLATEDSQTAFLAGIPIGPQITTNYTNEELILHLPGPQTLDGYNAVSVWCEDFDLNFGSGSFINKTPDVAWVFDNTITNSSYVLDSAEPNDIPFGTLGAEDPTLLLHLGGRYQVTILNDTTHPFEVLAKGATDANDTVLLSMATDTGVPLETDSEIGWEDDGAGTASFTLTQDLYDAMTGTGQRPGYRCGVHVSAMRGDFDVCLGEPVGDLDGNCGVDLLDFSLFAQTWLSTNIEL